MHRYMRVNDADDVEDVLHEEVFLEWYGLWLCCLIAGNI